MKRSIVQSSRRVTVTVLSLYSLRMRVAISFVRPLVCGTSSWMSTPPLSLRLIVTCGGSSFRRIPKLSNSRSMRNLCVTGLAASSTIMMRSHVRAAEITCRPRPFPVAAPSMIPGKSRTCIRAPRYRSVPGIAVSVVNSYAAASDFVPVSVVSSVDFPTLGNPTRPTRVSPTFFTSNPSPPPPPPFDCAASCSRRSFANFALINPR
mmetsp:Transcript_22866/g.71666  ORF Transcript_22866/g.71666 Transcript_22866/m.71666 type:complete len:206 (+) Transcript_22866:483-1100(+)